MTATSALSVRARQALGAAAVESFCRTAHINDASIDLFVAHLWFIACARDIPQWEETGRRLAITGLGDPLPPPLVKKIGNDAAARLSRVTEVAYEISMSRIFGNSLPAQSDDFLMRALAEAGVELPHKEVPAVLARHAGGADGWGEPVSPEDLSNWQFAARGYFGFQE